jgi:tetratricopeptide (TPR) repeat protein
MQNAQLAEAPLWEISLIPRLEIQADDLGIVSEAAHSFFIAHWAFKEGDIKTIENQIQGLKMKIATASLQVSTDGVAMCSAGTTRYAPNENSLRVARSLQLQMEAFVALLTDNKDNFEEKIIAATNLESETKYVGPPDIAFPSFEQYGYWLLENNRLIEALDQFNRSLVRAPRRVNALRGKLNVLEKLNRHDEASEISDELKSIWSKADDVALKYIAGI